MRRLLVVACAFVLATAVVVASAAAAQAKVGPNQYFRGRVNGQNGLAAPAVIRMACFGPIIPGQTGHPMAGQTVEVVRKTASVAGSGFTGPNATSIVVFFGVLPPTPVATGNITFTRYGVAQAIPTSLLLPCAGTGNVNFVPLPMSPPTSRAAAVRVNYIGQP